MLSENDENKKETIENICAALLQARGALGSLHSLPDLLHTRTGRGLDREGDTSCHRMGVLLYGNASQIFPV